MNQIISVDIFPNTKKAKKKNTSHRRSQRQEASAPHPPRSPSYSHLQEHKHHASAKRTLPQPKCNRGQQQQTCNPPSCMPEEGKLCLYAQPRIYTPRNCRNRRLPRTWWITAQTVCPQNQQKVNYKKQYDPQIHTVQH
jgi:hypothetical protein